MKKRLNVTILKMGSESGAILEIIAANNGGQVPICLDDLVSWGQCRKALYPLANKGFQIEKNEEGFNVTVSEDGGQTYTLIIEEIELHELAENEKEAVI